MKFEGSPSLSEQYKNHSIFQQLEDYGSFYFSLSVTVMGFIKPGAFGLFNLDSYVYSSIQGTLESISAVLKSGRINDGYSLLRKFYDSTIINIYSNLYLDQEYKLEVDAKNQINGWMKGKNKMPSYKIMSDYILKSEQLEPITKLVTMDDRYKKIRRRCNDHTHYNFFRYILHNDNQVYLGSTDAREKMLDAFSQDLKDLYVQHLAYILFLNGHYMMSSDHTDHLELGMTPPEGSEYWVSPPIQDTFDKVIKVSRPDIAGAIKEHTSMELS